ncbi:sulfur transferase domain-containing protein [Xanthobacteraceae bacterium Astr-EGSB]|uniref:fused DSP-PTPase phosphatase/NAD kinase-like protein n=1 Tax=Astrobacterium formosum TaxID=3069710 RepID=UPI0027B49B37|nr:sulfur transferase domain-containing protein [Xanthobacteraceae bacterium Astr-EGSB]
MEGTDSMIVHAKLIAAAFAGFLALMPAALAQTATEVPPSDKVSAAVTNYTRVRPQIASAGVLREGAVAELKGFGFTAILDLRTPQEGTQPEQRAALEAGLRYFNIPIGAVPIAEAQLVEFAKIVEDKSNHPLLIHCQSANRVGAMWTLYRAVRGAAFATAVTEGRTIGLKGDRERIVRAQLGQPPLGR